ncbi:MAG: hypothetical protein AB8G05_24690 [Oligoflexales bacterium]
MKRAIFGIYFTLCFFRAWESLEATPLFAVQASNQCGACHRPGRSEVEVSSRRCTLDCQGCHVDPNGAGPRNQWGYYFENEALASVNFFEPIDPLDDKSRFDLHYDGRIIQRMTEDSSRTFPMDSEISMRVRPLINWVHLMYQANFLGRVGDQSFRATINDPRRFQQKYSIMIDALPFNLYLRAFRGYSVYGLRHSNHSRWIREKLGFTPYALIDGLSFGGTPTVPFIHATAINGSPGQNKEDKQKGFSLHGGLRGVSFGWHIHGSYWKTKSEKAEISMHAIGGGLKLADFVLMGENNSRSVGWLNLELDETASYRGEGIRLHPSSKIGDYSLTFVGVPGVSLALIFEELEQLAKASHRRSLSIDWHPVPNLQFELWRRFESGARTLVDSLVLGHIYWDF